MERHEQSGLVWLSSPLLRTHHGFSTRLGGVSPAPYDSLNLGPNRGDPQANILENTRRFCAAIGADPNAMVLSAQVHETTVREVTEQDVGKGLVQPRDYTADALVTNLPGVTLEVFSADCTNLLLWDSVSGAVGAIHAGWRGCAAGIVERTVSEMGRLYGAKPETLYAAIGPCIGKCCFETSADVPAAMEASLGQEAAIFWTQRGEKWMVDLQGLNHLWLLRCGIPAHHIDCADLCTACHNDLFWSHRKMGTARGLQAAAICCGRNDT